MKTALGYFRPGQNDMHDLASTIAVLSQSQDLQQIYSEAKATLKEGLRRVTRNYLLLSLQNPLCPSVYTTILR